MHHFDVPAKVMTSRNCWGKFGMTLFFHRYKLLETTNFPIWTYGNAMALVILAFALFCAFTQYDKRFNIWALGVFLSVCSFTFFFSLSFVFTAPTICRIPWARRSYLCLVHYILCRFMESIEWCTGCNRYGYMMHLTANKLLAYSYVSPEQMEKVCSMAIVRNPYSRMVSIYQYNKFGPLESFPNFCRDWYRRIFYAYRQSAEMDEWYTPCHAIPQFEYTHYQGKQLVQSIVKQEELKYLKTIEDRPKAVEQDCTVADLPAPVRDALLGMPHTNSRQTSKKWYDYYDQDTLDLVYKMYQHDFVVFNYSPELTQRPDLKPPALYREELQQMQEVLDIEQEVLYGSCDVGPESLHDLEAMPPPQFTPSFRQCDSPNNHGGFDEKHDSMLSAPESPVASASVNSFHTPRPRTSSRTSTRTSASRSFEQMLRDSSKASPERHVLRQNLLLRSSTSTQGSNTPGGRQPDHHFRSSMVGSQQEVLNFELYVDHTTTTPTVIIHDPNENHLSTMDVAEEEEEEEKDVEQQQQPVTTVDEENNQVTPTAKNSSTAAG